MKRKEKMNEVIHNVYRLIAKGYEESFAIKTVAAKYDIADYEIAMYILGLES